VSEQAPKKILVVSGMGDLHFVLLKLEGFMKQREIDIPPEIWVWNLDGRPRSLGLVERVAFCTPGGYWNRARDDAPKQFSACYLAGTRDIDQVDGFDWFLCPNGKLRNGTHLSQALGGCETNWNYQLGVTAGEELFLAQYRAVSTPEVMLYFSDQGMFKTWLRAWPIQTIRRFIAELARLLGGYRLTLTGSTWDVPWTDRLLDEWAYPETLTSRVGKTTLDEFMAMVRCADGFVGWCGGNGMLATHLKIPTYMLWSDYFGKGMSTSWVDESRNGTIYLPAWVETLHPEQAAEEAAELILACGQPREFSLRGG